MADFPLSGHSDAVSKIILSVIPPKAYAYLAPFLPGLFFEVSVLLGNPGMAQQLIATSNQVALLGRYSTFFLAVFGAFVIGHALILWVGLVHRILGAIYRMGSSLWRRFCIWPLLPTLKYLMNDQTWLGRRLWIKRLRPILVPKYMYAQNMVFRNDASEGARKLWATLTRRSFKECKGIDLSLDQEEWNALYQASATAQFVELGNHLLMLATQALGWGGLVAIRFAPRLANKNYIIFSLFMIAIGVLYTLWFVRGLNSPYVEAMLKLRPLLKELRRMRVEKRAEAKGGERRTP